LADLTAIVPPLIVCMFYPQVPAIRFRAITYLPDLSLFNSYSALLQCARNSLPSSCGRSSGRTCVCRRVQPGGWQLNENRPPLSLRMGVGGLFWRRKQQRRIDL